MTIHEGQLGHVDHHDVLRTRILGEAARFGTTVTIGGPWVIGGPGHIAAHGEMEDAIKHIAATGGLTIPDLGTHPTLGQTGHIHDHELMEAALDIIRQADAYNEATGGTVTERWDGSKMWRTHTFTADDTFTVTKDVGRTFTLLLVGGGGGPGGSQPYGITAGGGGGGGVLLTTAALGVGAHAVTVGKAGTQGGENNPGNRGGNTTLGSHTALGGGGGGSYHGGPSTGGSGGGGAPGGSQGGAAGTAGQGHAGGNGWESGGPQFKTESGAGGGAGGAATHGGWDIPSQPGPGRTLNVRGTDEVFGAGGAAYWGTGYGFPGSHDGGAIVSYEIAPWNSATGGTVTEYTNGQGETWRAHTFTTAGSLAVAMAAQPFHVVMVGGGGGGGSMHHAHTGWDQYNAGAGVAIDQSVRLTVGGHPVVIGGGGGGAGNEQGGGGPGAPTTFAGLTASGGGGGSNVPPNPNGPSVTTTIRGTSETFAGGGFGGGGATTIGSTGGGAGQPGQAGLCIVAYRVK